MQVHEPTEAIEVASVKVLLYGLPGSRKTTFSMTAGNPLLVDADEGIRRVALKYRKRNIRPKTWEDCQNVVNYLEGVDTIITDTVGSVLDILTEYIKRNNPKLKRSDGALTIQGYGTLANTFRTGYLVPLEQTRKDLVFVAHHKEEKGKKDDETFLRPDITGQTLGALLRKMDLVGLVHIRDNRPCVTFTPTEAYFAKNSANLPEWIYLDETPLEEIIQQFKVAVNEDSIEYAAYVEQMAEVSAMIAAATDAASINAVINHCVDLSLKKAWIYSAKAEAGGAVKLKAEELGLVVQPDRTYLDPVKAELPKTEATANEEPTGVQSNAEQVESAAAAPETAQNEAPAVDPLEAPVPEPAPAPVVRPLAEVMAEAKAPEQSETTEAKNPRKTPKL